MTLLGSICSVACTTALRPTVTALNVAWVTYHDLVFVYVNRSHRRPGRPQAMPEASPGLSLPAIVVDADADAYAGCADADAGAVIPVAIAPVLDVALARRIGV